MHLLGFIAAGVWLLLWYVERVTAFRLPCFDVAPRVARLPIRWVGLRAGPMAWPATDVSCRAPPFVALYRSNLSEANLSNQTSASTGFPFRSRRRIDSGCSDE